MSRLSTPDYCYYDTIALPRPHQRFWSEPNLSFATTDNTLRYRHLLEPKEANWTNKGRELSLHSASVTNSSTLLQNITMDSADIRDSINSSRLEGLTDALRSEDASEMTVCITQDEEIGKQPHGAFSIGIDSWNTNVVYYQNNGTTKPTGSTIGPGDSNNILLCPADQPLRPAPSKPLPAVPTTSSLPPHRGTSLNPSVFKTKKDSGVSIDSIPDVSCKNSFLELNGSVCLTRTPPPSKPPMLQSPPQIIARSESCENQVSNDDKSRKMKTMNRKLRDLKTSRGYSFSSGPTPLPSPTEAEISTHSSLIASSPEFSSKATLGSPIIHKYSEDSIQMKVQQLNLSLTPIMLVAEQVPIPCTNKMLRRRPGFIVQPDHTHLKPNIIAVRAESESLSKALTSPTGLKDSLNSAPKSSKMLYGSLFPAPPAPRNSSKVRRPILFEKSESNHSYSDIEKRYFASLEEESKLLRQRNNHLERQNKMLEAALMVALRTAGRLNGCPCGGQEQRSTEISISGGCLDKNGEHVENDKLNAMEVFYRTRTRIDQLR